MQVERTTTESGSVAIILHHACKWLSVVGSRCVVFIRYPQVSTVAVEKPIAHEEVLSPDSPSHSPNVQPHHGFVNTPKAPSVPPPKRCFGPQPPQEPPRHQHVEEEEEEVHHEPLRVREHEPWRPGLLGGASFISAHQR